jgi:hypothetical protein
MEPHLPGNTVKQIRDKRNNRTYKHLLQQHLWAGDQPVDQIGGAPPQQATIADEQILEAPTPVAPPEDYDGTTPRNVTGDEPLNRLETPHTLIPPTEDPDHCTAEETD